MKLIFTQKNDSMNYSKIDKFTKKIELIFVFLLFLYKLKLLFNEIIIKPKKAVSQKIIKLRTFQY